MPALRRPAGEEAACSGRRCPAPAAAARRVRWRPTRCRGRRGRRRRCSRRRLRTPTRPRPAGSSCRGHPTSASARCTLRSSSRVISSYSIEMIAVATISRPRPVSPLVVLLDRRRQALGEADRVLLDLGDAVALRRIVRVHRERRGERADDLVEQLRRRVVVEIGEVEHLARLEIRRGHPCLDEQDRVDDLERVGAAGDRADLGVHVGVVPVDLRLGAEAVVRQLLQRHEVGALLAPGWPPNLKRSHDVLISGLTMPSPAKIDCEFWILAVPLVGARLGERSR